MAKRQVRVVRGFNAPGMPEVWEVQARRRWQKEWTILRVYTTRKIAEADAILLKRRIFTDEEKDMMKGAS